MNKKIKIVIIVFVIVIFVALGIFLIQKDALKEYEITGYDMSIKVPSEYVKDKDAETEILALYNLKNSITISALKFDDNFWSSGDTLSRMDEYMEVVSAANYDANISNVKLEPLENTNDMIGRVDLELSKPNGASKGIALITDEKIGNVVIEINGSKEDMESNSKEIEKIIKSLKIEN